MIEHNFTSRIPSLTLYHQKLSWVGQFRNRRNETAGSPIFSGVTINTDQTECAFQSTYNRSYSYQGEKRTEVAFKQIKKTTHSYTAQYSMTMSGKLLKTVFLCMQELSGTFGPLVQTQVNRLAEDLGNVFVIGSKSGKLSTTLYKDYLTNIIKPYVEDNEFCLTVDSWSGQINTEIYDEIFTNHEDNCSPQYTLKIIPGKCTSSCQPLDVYFFRQVKILIKSIQNNAHIIAIGRDMSSHEENIRLHSLIHHQLSGDIFQPIIRYAWFACGLIEEKPPFENVTQVCFPRANIIVNVSGVLFLRCAVCHQYLCIICFLDNHFPKNCSFLQTLHNIFNSQLNCKYLFLHKNFKSPTDLQMNLTCFYYP